MRETSLKDWEIKDDTLYFNEQEIVQVYQVTDGSLVMTDTKELMDLFETSFKKETVYQNIDEDSYHTMKAIRTLIPVYSDSQTPFNANIESSIELKSFIISTKNQGNDQIMKALKDHGKTALEGKVPVIKQPLSIDDQGNDHIYGVRFIPFYERIDLVSEGIRYQVYDPLIDHEEVDGLFVVIKNPDRVS